MLEVSNDENSSKSLFTISAIVQLYGDYLIYFWREAWTSWGIMVMIV